MAKLTLSQFTSEVVLACRNMATSDPYYSQIPAYLTRARNKIIRTAIGPRLNVGLFPELNNSWTVGPTDVTTNVVDRPADAVAITAVHCAHNNAAAVAITPPDWSQNGEFELTYLAPPRFGLLSKATTTGSGGWPTIFTRKGPSIIIYPTPTAGYTDWLRMYGVKFEQPLVNPNQVFVSDQQWDDVTVLKAAAMLMLRKGWSARAAELEQAVLDELGRTANVEALEEGMDDGVMETDFDMSRTDSR